MKARGAGRDQDSPSLFKKEPGADPHPPASPPIRGRKGRRETAGHIQPHLSNILSTPGDAGPGSGFLLEISGAAFGGQAGPWRAIVAGADTNQ